MRLLPLATCLAGALLASSAAVDVDSFNSVKELVYIERHENAQSISARRWFFAGLGVVMFGGWLAIAIRDDD